MIKQFFLLLILVCISSCGQKNNFPTPKNNNQKTDTIKDAQTCLEKKAGYLASPPVNLIEFAEVVSQAAMDCKANRNDVTKYSRRIGEKYGDL